MCFPVWCVCVLRFYFQCRVKFLGTNTETSSCFRCPCCHRARPTFKVSVWQRYYLMLFTPLLLPLHLPVPLPSPLPSPSPLPPLTPLSLPNPNFEWLLLEKARMLVRTFGNRETFIFTVGRAPSETPRQENVARYSLPSLPLFSVVIRNSSRNSACCTEAWHRLCARGRGFWFPLRFLSSRVSIDTVAKGRKRAGFMVQNYHKSNGKCLMFLWKQNSFCSPCFSFRRCMCQAFEGRTIEGRKKERHTYRQTNR